MMDEWMSILMDDWMASSSGGGFYNSAFGCFFKNLGALPPPPPAVITELSFIHFWFCYFKAPG